MRFSNLKISLYLFCYLPILAVADPVVLPGTESFSLKNAAGQQYQIMVSLPEQQSADKPAAVLYLLDGNAFFAAFHDGKRLQRAFADHIIVAIGYPTETPFDFYRRSYDFSPPVDQADVDPPQGGQDEFLAFLENTLQPEISKRYLIDNQRQALFGHSFGGMFTLYAMFSRPQLVNHYIASSPTLWWHNRYLLTAEIAFSEQAEMHKLNNKSLLLVVAEGDPIQERQDAVLLAERMVKLSRFGLRSAFHQQEDETHMSLPVSIAYRVLQQAFTPRLQ